MQAALRAVVQRAWTHCVAGPLQGSLDRIETDGVGDLIFEGWAFDPLVPTLPVVLQVAVGDLMLGTVVACDHRVDLEQAGKGQGRCSFALRVPCTLSRADLSRVRVRRLPDRAEVWMSDACFARIAEQFPLRS